MNRWLKLTILLKEDKRRIQSQKFHGWVQQWQKGKVCNPYMEALVLNTAVTSLRLVCVQQSWAVTLYINSGTFTFSENKLLLGVFYNAVLFTFI